MINIRKKLIIILIIMILLLYSSCIAGDIISYKMPLEKLIVELNEQYNNIIVKDVYVEKDYLYATFSQIHNSPAKLYMNSMTNDNITVCINAGHGTDRGDNYYTFIHPDKSPMILDNYKLSDENMTLAISNGSIYNNGLIKESELNLKVATVLRDLLLSKGYSVLMIREEDDTRLDNVARIILANKYADIHVSIHFDSSDNAKGAFFIAPIRDSRYLSMENVKNNYESIEKIGRCIVDSFINDDIKVFQQGVMRKDLMQFAYSKIPSVLVECGDGWTDFSNDNLYKIATSIYKGIDNYFCELYEN